MPGGDYGGSRELMQQIAPSGPIYQADKLSGNPVAMADGLAMLELIQAPGFHADIERRTNGTSDGIKGAAGEAGVALTTQPGRGLVRVFVSSTEVATKPKHP